MLLQMILTIGKGIHKQAGHRRLFFQPHPASLMIFDAPTRPCRTPKSFNYKFVVYHNIDMMSNFLVLVFFLQQLTAFFL